MTIKLETLEAVFTDHPPTGQQEQDDLVLRSKAKDFADAILRLTPVCGDQQAALRHLRIALMEANAAIALEGLV